MEHAPDILESAAYKIMDITFGNEIKAFLIIIIIVVVVIIIVVVTIIIIIILGLHKTQKERRVVCSQSKTRASTCRRTEGATGSSSNLLRLL
jgi:flagellar basal body-associated protein FliL